VVLRGVLVIKAKPLLKDKAVLQKDKILSHPLFEIVTTTKGAISIRNKKVNEIMHNPVGPWIEANSLYIEQSKLEDKLQNAQSELVVFDVGLGAAANALATLHCFKKINKPARLVSFEIDLELIKFTLEHHSVFPHFKGYELILEKLLKDRCWEEGHIKWELHEGDFLETIDNVTSTCHLVYYDPYSPKVNQEMWTTGCFRKLKEKCSPEAEFYNYSQATPIRAALLEAGFFVGYGMSIGEKNATTQAAVELKNLNNPLDQRWFSRWQKSHTPYPYECLDNQALKRTIEQHEQFQFRIGASF
jgi:tRNA U34 5-methylaminomethyl-2-thiouridine-forming methyltransferase MnmC